MFMNEEVCKSLQPDDICNVVHLIVHVRFWWPWPSSFVMVRNEELLYLVGSDVVFIR